MLGLVKSVLGAGIGSMIDRDRDSGALRDKYNYLERKGLTPQEIAGSSFGASPSTTSANTLGNQAAEMAKLKAQQRYDEKQRTADRAIAVRAQDVSTANTEVAANANIQSSALAAGASRYSSDNSRAVAEMNNALARDRFVNVELPDALRKSITESPNWQRLRILAGMGVDNMIGTAIGNKYGLDPMDPDALSQMSASDFRKMVTEIYGLQSRIFGETAGSATVVGNGLSEIGSSIGRFLGNGGD